MKKILPVGLITLASLLSGCTTEKRNGDEEAFKFFKTLMFGDVVPGQKQVSKVSVNDNAQGFYEWATLDQEQCELQLSELARIGHSEEAWAYFHKSKRLQEIGIATGSLELYNGAKGIF